MRNRFSYFLVAASVFSVALIAPAKLYASSYDYKLVADEVTGSLNGVSFTDEPITFTTTAPSSSIHYIINTVPVVGEEIFPASIAFSINDVGSGTLTASPYLRTDWQYSDGDAEVSIGERTGGGELLDLYNSHLGSNDGWGYFHLILTMATAPYSSTSGTLEYTSSVPFSTSVGDLILLPPEDTNPDDRFNYRGTFYVAYSPEPSSLFLLGSGLVGLIGAMRRKSA